MVPICVSTFCGRGRFCGSVGAIFAVRGVRCRNGCNCSLCESILKLPRRHFNVIRCNSDVGLVGNTVVYTSGVAAISPACSHRVLRPCFDRNLSNVLGRCACGLYNVMGNVSISICGPRASPLVCGGFASSSLSNGTMGGRGLRRRVKVPRHSSMPMVNVIAHLMGRGNLSLIGRIFRRLLRTSLRFTVLNSNR